MRRTAGYSEAKAATLERKTSERMERNAQTLKPLGQLRAPRGGKLAPIERASKAVSSEQRELAKMKFDMYDVDGSGCIDKKELKNVLRELLDASDGVLDQYVQLVFRQHDTDFSGSLSFDEFVGIYSQLLFEKAKQGFSFQDWQKSRKK